MMVQITRTCNISDSENEYVTCVAYVPGEIWSRGLELFMMTGLTM